jgi:hypothetical protein
MVDTDFVNQAEWTEFVNDEWFELYDILVTRYEGYFETTAEATVITTSLDYELPNNTYKVLAVDVGDNADHWISIYPYAHGERNHSSYLSNSCVRYQIIGNSIRLDRMPSNSTTVRIRFVPLPERLENDLDELPTGLCAHWSTYIVVGATIKALLKEESDVQALMAEKAALAQRIATAASRRDVSAPVQVGKTRYDYSEFTGNEGEWWT